MLHQRENRRTHDLLHRLRQNEPSVEDVIRALRREPIGSRSRFGPRPQRWNFVFTRETEGYAHQAGVGLTLARRQSPSNVRLHERVRDLEIHDRARLARELRPEAHHQPVLGLSRGEPPAFRPLSAAQRLDHATPLLNQVRVLRQQRLRPVAHERPHHQPVLVPNDRLQTHRHRVGADRDHQRLIQRKILPRALPVAGPRLPRYRNLQVLLAHAQRPELRCRLRCTFRVLPRPEELPDSRRDHLLHRTRCEETRILERSRVAHRRFRQWARYRDPNICQRALRSCVPEDFPSLAIANANESRISRINTWRLQTGISRPVEHPDRQQGYVRSGVLLGLMEPAVTNSQPELGLHTSRQVRPKIRATRPCVASIISLFATIRIATFIIPAKFGISHANGRTPACRNGLASPRKMGP